MRVSILAHPERWALLRKLQTTVRDVVFQSSPTPKGGRYWEPWTRHWITRVSILAHPERWALPSTSTASLAKAHCFNPRPPRKVGATGRRMRCWRDGACFNPRPPRKVGATTGRNYNDGNTPVSILAHPERWALPPGAGPYFAPTHVSILAHPERWALLFTGWLNRQKSLSFQSSPTPKGGRYPLTTNCRFGRRVFQSSPTPKGGRYLSYSTAYTLGPTFQSSPTPKGGRYSITRPLSAVIALFQSSPTPKGGRYSPTNSTKPPTASFNPRPPRKVGATVNFLGSGRPFLVSILAHPERWALRTGCPGRACHGHVSILAHPERWALRRLRDLSATC